MKSSQAAFPAAMTGKEHRGNQNLEGVEDQPGGV